MSVEKWNTSIPSDVIDFTKLPLLYGLCADCKDPLMFFVGSYMQLHPGISICVECPMDEKQSHKKTSE